MFLDLDSQSTGVPGMGPSGELLCQVTFWIPDEEQSEQNIATLCLTNPQVNPCYEAAAQFSDEEQDNKMAMMRCLNCY